MNCKEQSDAQLYDAWSAGDRRAGGELSRRYLPVLVRFVRGRVGDPAAAKDVVGATLLQLVKSRDSLKDPSQFRSFLMGIAWNTLKSHYRKRSHERLHFVGDENLDLVEQSNDCPEDRMTTDFGDSSMLVQALGRLPIEDQQLLMSYYAQGMSYVELGKVYGLEPGTVASRLNAVKTRLATVLQTPEIFDGANGDGARDFSCWARRVRQGLERPRLGAVLPRRVRWWRLTAFESIGTDSIRSAYRRWQHPPIIELEIHRTSQGHAREARGKVAIGGRDWVMQRDRGRQEYALQALLRDGRTLRLAHRPATEWKQATRFVEKLDVEKIEQYQIDDDDSLWLTVERSEFVRDALELTRALARWGTLGGPGPFIVLGGGA